MILLKNSLNHKIIYDSHSKLIKDERVNSVYIATTNNFHKELIISSAKHKKNIICEKPACLNEKILENVWM